MDKWTDVQAKRMQLGGNTRAITFFKEHPDYRDSMKIPEKYNSEFAVFYKEKLVAECEGKDWVMPPIGSRRPQQQPEQQQQPGQPGRPSKAQTEAYLAVSLLTSAREKRT
jgi:ADP-ribosylation factor GTPase-activating protein 1